MNRIQSQLAVLFALCCALCSHAAVSLPISGEWRFQLDRQDAGITEAWFKRELPDRIQLPGALQSQGFGDEISVNTPWVLSLYDRLWFLRDDYKAYTNAGNVKVPFVCQPPRHYLGAAWYQREIEIPKDWEGQRVVLHLERPHWESRVWFDDRQIGTNNSLCAPHEFELGLVSASRDSTLANITPGKHILTVRVDNRMLLPYRPDAHAVSDSLNSTWNGIVGKMELRSTPPVWMDDVQVFPNLERQSASVRVRIGNATASTLTNEFIFTLQPEYDSSIHAPEQRQVACAPGWTEITVEVKSDQPIKLWDEFEPRLYWLTARTRHRTGAASFTGGQVEVVTFGFRDFRRDGTRLVVNGRETHLRGTHHGGDFPITGYPPTDVDYWRKLIRTCQKWGQNHMRFHSFCPPEAAFRAADELGFYLQPEPGMWNTFDPGSPMERMLYLETERMIKAYGNHPSFVVFAASNEPKGRWKQVLPQWAEHFRTNDARRLYTTGTGFTDSDAPGPVDRVDFTTTQRFGSRPVRRESAWFGRDYSGSIRGVNVPVIAHELGQWCAYPDFSVIAKFTGYMRPGNYEIFRDSAQRNGVLDRNKELAWASGRFQLACYKEEIEANLRTPGLAGFQLLDLHDYVGQGTALVGLLDPFWETKGYATAEEFRRFCDRTVPLARLRNRTFTTSETLAADIEVAHFNAAPLTNASVTWSIVDRSGHAVASGDLGRQTIPIGRSRPGKLESDLSKLKAPAAYRLVVRAGPAENDWNFWVYPARDSKPVPTDVLVTSSWAEAEAKLARGGKVLFVPRNADLSWNCPPLDDLPVFWNRLMNPGWSRMLGILCDTNHPALAGFPTDPNCDWQWTQIIRGVRPMNLSGFPAKLQPIVQAVDDWNRNWKLGALFECRVGSGKLVVSSFDLTGDLPRRPVARQLCRSLLDYMASPLFEPAVEVSPADFKTVLFDSRIMQKTGAKAAGEGNVGAAVDGDPNTAWVAGGTGRNASGTKHPHALTVGFPEPVKLTGVVLMPRQNDRDHLGDIREYVLEMSDDGQHWTQLAKGEMPSSWAPFRIEFAPVAARQLRLTALSGYGRDSSAALAEFALIYDGPELADSSPGNIEYRRSRSTSADVDEGGEISPGRTNANPRNR